MQKKSFIKILLERRIPQIMASYLVAGTSLILFIEYLVEKYQFPSYYPTLALFALIGILPSVIILSYFHGAPGKDEWTNIEKVGIPINVLFIAGALFFGDSLNIWEMDQNISDNDIPNVHLIYIGSPEENNNFAYRSAEKYLSAAENEGSEIFSFDELELKNLRSNIEAGLYSEFYNQNLTIKVLKNDEEIRFVDNSVKKYIEIDMQSLAGGIYKFFDEPTHIIFVRVYAMKSNKGEILKYIYDVFGGMGDGWWNIMRIRGIRETMQKAESNILDNIISQIIEVKNNFARGEVIKIEGNYIYINPMNLIMKNNMNLIGYRKWDLNDNDGDGFTDKDSSYYKWIKDVKEGIDYVDSAENYDKEKILLQKQYNWLISDSLRSTPKGQVSFSHTFSLKVISVKDSIVIAELLEIPPWVEVNIGDGVRVK